MKHITVRCFEGFQCLAGTCPDTCCAGWEVDLDEDILEKYAASPGALGDEIRSRIRQEDGYTFFEMNGTRCPFLNEENLCRLILEAGEDHLSTTCREHPRFWEDYGNTRETCLAISCPEAARRLFSEPFRLKIRETEEPGIWDEALDAELLESLTHIRDLFFEVAADETISMLERLDELRQLGYQAAGLPDAPLHELRDVLAEMCRFAFTDHRLKTRLEGTLAQLPEAKMIEARYQEFPMEAENLLLYFLYRYILQAVWDGCITEKVLFSICAVAVIFTVAQAQPGDYRENLRETAILFSREIEHSPENLSRMYAFL